MTGRFTVGQLALRSFVVLGLQVALWSTAPAGVAPAVWLVVTVGVLSVAAALQPGSLLGTVATLLVLAWWGIAFRAGVPPEAILAAAGLITAHVALILSDYGPGGLPLDRHLLRLWAGRAAAVLVAAPVTWALATSVRGRAEPPGLWVTGLVVAVVALVVADFALRAPTERR